MNWRGGTNYSGLPSTRLPTKLCTNLIHIAGQDRKPSRGGTNLYGLQGWYELVQTAVVV